MGDGLKTAAICIAGFLTMFTFLYVFANPDVSPISGKVSTSQPKGAPNTGYTIEHIEPEPEIDYPADSDKMDLYEEASRMILNTQFEGNYSYECSDDTVIIGVWRDGIAAGAVSLASGDETLRDEWEEMVDGIGAMAKSQYELFDSLGIYGKHCIVNILNDQNRENTLVMFYDGMKVLDAAE